MRAILFLAAGILALLPVTPTNAQTPHCLLGCPTEAPATNQEINRSIYILSNNPETKFADWVAYRVNPAFFTEPQTRGGFATDPDLLSNDTITKKEYDDANVAMGVDRGHQAPFATFKNAPDSKQTNFLSNVTPQFTKLNQGAWKELEAAVRKLARDNPTGAVFVMTGPLYEWPMAKLPDTDKDHQVPSAYWKIVAMQAASQQITVAGFYFYQDTPKRANYCDHMRPIRFIEQKSGLNFFSDMTGALEDQFETSQPTLVAKLGC